MPVSNVTKIPWVVLEFLLKYKQPDRQTDRQKKSKNQVILRISKLFCKSALAITATHPTVGSHGAVN